MKMNNELLAKAKGAKTPEELLAIAKENGTELTEESAKAYFELLHPKTGEISDDELDNVSGGGCYKGDRLVVSVLHVCRDWKCKRDGSDRVERMGEPGCRTCGVVSVCSNCKFLSYEKGLWLCNNPVNRKK